MRTTVTLAPDLAVKIKALAVDRQISFKEAINSTLRAGLDSRSGRGRPYREEVRDLGIRPGVDLTKALHLAATLEDEETVRELDRRK